MYMYNYVGGQMKPWGNLFPNQVNLFQPTCRSIWFLFVLAANKKYFWAPLIFFSSSFFSSSPLYLPHLLFPLCSPNIPASILLTCISMIILWALNHRPLVFIWICVLMSLCPNASHVQRLGCKLFHYFFNYLVLYIVIVINFFKLFKSDMYVGPSNSTLYWQ